MKTVVGMITVLAMVILLNVLFLSPTSVTGFARYEGARPDTKIVLNVPVISMELGLPRFPLDVLLYSPLKLISYVDINVLDKDDSIQARKLFLTIPLKSQYSLAFCYLRMLYEYEVDLPEKSEIRDITYDVSKYVKSNTTVFSLGTVDLESMKTADLEQLMKAMTVQAQRDTVKTNEPLENCIVEVSLGQSTRYLWGYHLTDRYLYVVDPCAPQLLYARVDLKTKEYHSGLNVYKVRSFIKKIATPVALVGGKS